MPVQKIDDRRCDTCTKPATHVDVGFKGMVLEASKGWACDEHAIDIDLKPIEEVFGEQ